MKKLAKMVLSSLILTMIFATVLSVSPANVSAAVWDDGLTNFTSGATDLPNGTTDLKAAIGEVIQIFLGFLGILAVVLIIYAGFLWMTAGGDSGKVDKAKDYIKNAVIGIVIILAAYIITSFVLEQVNNTLGI
ncbi:hypothetical protein GW933_03820 [Candidatus Falkowbacteria bacterium]|uniref:Uncharacterized protein n=1 Tax=Candidatus Buchananbacteria bacterium CG10_big_fil_rev_8_21_14_0_10_33_19 TaxID=1974525 RepID=A0A2H0W5H4_9BACT|nr:hypothetical protein [Candidatus Falkowbacteria bacterium]PIS06527.1 MAG: hypothetical protein COT80_00185 [Candidatus Buchananbacteria bacterium CG10_big_fil_rev_8_21_14_0_10_33_19]